MGPACICTVVTRNDPSPSREANSSRPRRNRSLYGAPNDSRYVNICRMALFQTGALNSRPITLLPLQHRSLKRNNGKYLPLCKKYHAQVYGAVKASLHIPSTAPHGGVVGLPPPPHYTRWLDTRAARTPCRTEPEQFSHLPSSYATRRHHKLHGLQLKVRMSQVSILSQANPLYILTPYFFTTPAIITTPTTTRSY